MRGKKNRDFQAIFGKCQRVNCVYRFYDERKVHFEFYKNICVLAAEQSRHHVNYTWTRLEGIILLYLLAQKDWLHVNGIHFHRFFFFIPSNGLLYFVIQLYVTTNITFKTNTLSNNEITIFIVCTTGGTYSVA